MRRKQSLDSSTSPSRSRRRAWVALGTTLLLTSALPAWGWGQGWDWDEDIAPPTVPNPPIQPLETCAPGDTDPDCAELWT